MPGEDVQRVVMRAEHVVRLADYRRTRGCILRDIVSRLCDLQPRAEDGINAGNLAVRSTCSSHLQPQVKKEAGALLRARGGGAVAAAQRLCAAEEEGSRGRPIHRVALRLEVDAHARAGLAVEEAILARALQTLR